MGVRRNFAGETAGQAGGWDQQEGSEIAAHVAIMPRGGVHDLGVIVHYFLCGKAGKTIFVASAKCSRCGVRHGQEVGLPWRLNVDNWLKGTDFC